MVNLSVVFQGRNLIDNNNKKNNHISLKRAASLYKCMSNVILFWLGASQENFSSSEEIRKCHQKDQEQR